jgi:hypothetical protein
MHVNKHGIRISKDGQAFLLSLKCAPPPLVTRIEKNLPQTEKKDLEREDKSAIGG